MATHWQLHHVSEVNNGALQAPEQAPAACAQVLDCIAPGPDEIVLPKTSSSVFTSTNVDYILRSLEVKYLVLAGCVTDQCVESAVREACDKHYYVTLVTGTARLIADATNFVGTAHEQYCSPH